MWLKRGLLCWPGGSYIRQMASYIGQRASCVGQRAYITQKALYIRQGASYIDERVLRIGKRISFSNRFTQNTCIGQRASCIYQTAYCFSQGPPYISLYGLCMACILLYGPRGTSSVGQAPSHIR